LRPRVGATSHGCQYLSARPPGRLDGAEDHAGCPCVKRYASHDHATEGVEEKAHVGHAGTNVRSVTHNWLVAARLTRSGCRCTPGSGLVVRTRAATGSGDPSLSHEPGDLVTADIVAAEPRCLPQLADAVDPGSYPPTVA
jgi:hypothetical protein